MVEKRFGFFKLEKGKFVFTVQLHPECRKYEIEYQDLWGQIEYFSKHMYSQNYKFLFHLHKESLTELGVSVAEI